ncbi:hypothetical protein FHX35_000778 [Auritidibacter ignavus]|nr:hypothetical protein [Auritidibacter ignavus]
MSRIGAWISFVVGKKHDTEDDWLVVLPREVVNAFSWGETSDAGVGSVMIVVMESGLVGISVFVLAGVGPGGKPIPMPESC